jgi:hypothetical protein
MELDRVIVEGIPTWYTSLVPIIISKEISKFSDFMALRL